MAPITAARAAGAATQLTADARGLARLTIACALVLCVGKLGELCAPALLARDADALLLLLNSNDAFAAVTYGRIPTVQWYAVVICRRVAEDYFFFWLGRRYGAGAFAFFGVDVGRERCRAHYEQKKGMGLAVMCLYPTAPICVLAGMFGSAHFLLVDLFATVGRATLWVSFAGSVGLDSLLDWARASLIHYSELATLVFAVLAVPTFICAHSMAFRGRWPVMLGARHSPLAGIDETPRGPLAPAVSVTPRRSPRIRANTLDIGPRRVRPKSADDG